MKYLFVFLMLVSPFALASGNNTEPRNQPRGNEPTPYNDPQPDHDPLKERTPYPNPDDSVDYQRDSEDRQLNFRSYENDPRYTGLLCAHLLTLHSRWH